MAEVIELDIRAKSQQAQFELDKAIDRVKELQRQAKSIPIGADSAGINLKLQIARQEVQGLKSDLRNIRLGDKLGDDLSSINGQLGKSSGFLSEIKSGASSALGFGAAAIGALAVTKLAGAVSEAVASARQFEKTIAEINAILPRNAKLTAESVAQLDNLSRLYGTTSEQQARAYYQAVSAGAEDAAAANAILAASNEASLATQSDLSSVSRVLTSTLNAYAGTGLTAARATDILVKSVDDGAVEFQELTNQLARVTPTAAALKVPFDQVIGSIAFLTRVGFTTEQATTSLAAALSSIVKPTKEAQTQFQRLGGDLEGLRLNADSVAKAGGLIEFLQKVTKEAEGSTDILTSIFGDERATKAVLAITNNFAEYEKVLKNVNNSSGAAKLAADELGKTYDQQAKKLDASLSLLSRNIGQALIPTLTKLTQAANESILFVPLTEAQKNAVEVSSLTGRIAELYTQVRVLRGAGQLGFIDTTDEVASLDAAIARLQARVSGYQTDSDLTPFMLRQTTAVGDLRTAIRQFNDDISNVTTPLLPGADLSTPSPVDAAKATNALLTEEERRFQGEILALKQQAFYDQQALALELENQEAIRKETGYISQQELELQQATLRAEAAYQGEIQKNAAVLAGNELALANQLAFDKRKATLDAAETKRETADSKGKLAFAQLINDKKNQLAIQGLGLAAAIAKDGSKEQFFIQKAAALGEIAIYRGKAIAAIPAQTAALPAPLVPAAAAKLTAYANLQAGIGAATIAAAAIKGFAGGGIVGSPQGATVGPDNRLATVRDGEMILNADQQKKLFDMIQGGGMAGSIIIQVDGREIARAVRDQVQQGYKIQ